MAYEPLDGYQGDRDAVELPWAEWEQQARDRGIDLIDLLAEPPED
jgi:hypothetical protein